MTSGATPQCPNCYRGIPEGARFCAFCGMPVPLYRKKGKVEAPKEIPSLESLAGPCSVLRSSLTPFDIGRVGRILAKAAKAPLSDVTRQINASRGFLISGVGPDTARELAPQLDEAGLDFFIVPDDSIEDLPEAGRFSSGVFNDDGMNCEVNLPDHWKNFKRGWEDVMLVSCGRLSADISETREERVGFLYRVDKIETRVTHKFVIDLILRSPDERIRIEEERQDRGATALRSEPLTQTHLMHIARQIFQYSADIPKSEGVRMLAFDGPAGFWANATFPTRRDFERYTQWLLLLMKYGKPLP